MLRLGSLGISRRSKLGEQDRPQPISTFAIPPRRPPCFYRDERLKRAELSRIRLQSASLACPCSLPCVAKPVETLSVRKRLRILHLEDEPDYSRLVGDLLTKDGVEADLVLVSTKTDFDAALERENFDLILADYSLPTCTGIEALGTARGRAPQTPFLLVSGTIGEQVAIDSLQAGATDYVLKQWPDRLVPAVRRALREAEEHALREQAEAELARREKIGRASCRERVCLGV